MDVLNLSGKLRNRTKEYKIENYHHETDGKKTYYISQYCHTVCLLMFCQMQTKFEKILIGPIFFKYILVYSTEIRQCNNKKEIQKTRNNFLWKNYDIFLHYTSELLFKTANIFLYEQAFSAFAGRTDKKTKGSIYYYFILLLLLKAFTCVQQGRTTRFFD